MRNSFSVYLGKLILAMLNTYLYDSNDRFSSVFTKKKMRLEEAQ